MKFPRLLKSDYLILLFLAAYALVLAVLVLTLPDAQLTYAFSEEGPFERMSIAAWLFAALIILLRIRPLGMRAVAFALLYAAFAAREADWHKAFTADSILKTNYYKHAVAPFGEKAVALVAALAFIGLAAYVGIVMLRFLLLQKGWMSRSGIWLLLGAALVVLGKGMDRAPAILAEDYGIILPPILDHLTAAFEEGLEMLHPLIMAWSAWISQHERRYLS